MAYKVIRSFIDMQDESFLYKEGDTFPRKGLDVLPSRIKELATTANKRGEILIKEIEDVPKATKKTAKKAEKEE